MARTITLKRDDTCRDCGAQLIAGDLARWSRGAVWGVGCHDRNGNATGERPKRSRGALASDRARINVARGTLDFQVTHGQISREDHERGMREVDAFARTVGLVK